MPVFNPSTMNLLGWADKLTPRTGEMTVAGIKAGLSIQQTLDDMKYLRERRPLELATARIKAAHAEAEYDSFKTMNSMEMLDIKSKRIMMEERKRLSNAQEGLKTSVVLQDYESWAAPRIAKLVTNKDYEGLAAFTLKAQEKYGDDYWRTEKSDLGSMNVGKRFTAEENNQINMDLKRLQAKELALNFNVTDTMRDINRDALDLASERTAISRELKEYGGLPLRSLGVQPKKGKAFFGPKEVLSNRKTRNVGLTARLELMADRINKDPVLPTANPEFVKAMDMLKSGFSRTDSGRTGDEWLYSPGETKSSYDDYRGIAIDSYNTIHKLTLAIGSKDKGVSTEAQKKLDDYIKKLESMATFIDIGRGFSERSNAIEKRRQEELVRISGLPSFRKNQISATPRANDLYTGPDGKTHRRK